MENNFFENRKKEENGNKKINCFPAIFDRESKKFLDCMDKASSNIIKDLWSNTSNVIDYDKLKILHDFCDFSTQVGFMFIEKHLSNLFIKNKEEVERSPYNIYSTGLRKVTTRLSKSMLIKKVIPFFNLENVVDVVEIHKNQLSEFLKYLDVFFNEVEKYSTNLDSGTDKIKSEDKKSDLFIRLYATLKTWTVDDDFYTFIDNFNKFLNFGFELIIVSPIELYLKLGKDEIIVIWKMLVALDQEELRDSLNIADSIKFSDHLYNSIKDETRDLGIIHEIQKLFRETIKVYVDTFKKDQESLRSLIGSKEERKNFIEKYEKGTIFT